VESWTPVKVGKRTKGKGWPKKVPDDSIRLQDIRPHDLRRTGRTHVSGLGIRDEVGEALLNHAKEAIRGTYNLYSYWMEERKR